MTEHILKLNDKYFDAVKNGVKTFEVRKNDRDFKVGDTLIMHRIDANGQKMKHTDNEYWYMYDVITASIVYILSHEDFPAALKEGYAVLGIGNVVYSKDLVEKEEDLHE